MTEESNIISIDGTDYIESDLSEKQKTYIYHIRDLQQKVSRRKLELEPLEVALEFYSKAIIDELKEPYEFENGEKFENDRTN